MIKSYFGMPHSGLCREREISRRGWLVLLHVPEQLLDPFGIFLRMIENEMQLGKSAQLQPFDNLTADVAGSVLQRLDRIALFLGISIAHIDEHAGMFHV